MAHWIAAPVSKGSRSQLYAVTGAEVKANQFYGSRFGLLDAPKKLNPKSNFLTDVLAKKLWDYSEEVTG